MERSTEEDFLGSLAGIGHGFSYNPTNTFKLHYAICKLPHRTTTQNVGPGQ